MSESIPGFSEVSSFSFSVSLPIDKDTLSSSFGLRDDENIMVVSCEHGAVLRRSCTSTHEQLRAADTRTGEQSTEALNRAMDELGTSQQGGMARSRAISSHKNEFHPRSCRWTMPQD